MKKVSSVSRGKKLEGRAARLKRDLSVKQETLGSGPPPARVPHGDYATEWQPRLGLKSPPEFWSPMPEQIRAKLLATRGDIQKDGPQSRTGRTHRTVPHLVVAIKEARN